jgi:hypothetical protein
MAWRWIAILLLLLTAPVSAAEYPSYLAGHWFGQGEPNDKSEMWLALASANGDFAVHFRACRKGKPRDLIQKGSWWFQDGIEHVQITSSGDSVVFNETPYRILAHDGKHQTYSMPSGFIFHSSRVDANFQMPACDLVS